MSKDKKPSPNVVDMVALKGEAPPRTIARCLLDPATTAANTLNRIHQGTSADTDINAYIAELQAQAQLASTGDLGRSESMLMGQAATLDALFHKLVWWGFNHTGQNGNAAFFETCMRLAFKAQSQCRATNETLAAIKNPPVVYARQANFAAGHQQVNNSGEPLRTREIENPPTKLLETEHGERLDSGATATTGRADQAVETVGAVNGTENAGR